jgi:hypothetical protein
MNNEKFARLAKARRRVADTKLAYERVRSGNIIDPDFTNDGLKIPAILLKPFMKKVVAHFKAEHEKAVKEWEAL